MKNISKLIILSLTFLTFLIANCQTYYADIDGDGDGAKSVWCSYTDLPHATGGNWEDANFETNGCGTVGWNGDTTAGHLTYGPYISTDPGTTHVTWNMLANGDVDNDGTQIATIDIYDSTSEELLAWQDINVNDFNGSMAWQDFSLSYYSSPDHVYEFRTWYTGTGGHLVLRYITHINEDADTAGAYATTTLCDDDDTSGWSLNDDDLFPTCSVDNYSNVDWAGDQNSDGFYGFDGDNLYINVESYPNIGAATLIVNGTDYAMDYADWGDNAHWSYQLPTTASTSYDWAVAVATCGGTSQTVSGTFSADCNNAFNGTTVEDDCGVCGGDGSSCIVAGCTDDLACNFNEEANVDDGTCEYSCHDNGNYSLSFDGEDDFVLIPGFDGEYTNFSFMTNAYIEEINNYQHMLFYFGSSEGGENNYTRNVDLGIDNVNFNPPQLRVNLNYDYGKVGTQDFNTFGWINISGVFDGSNQLLSLYLNGELIGTTNTSANEIILNINDFHNTIGAGWSDSNQETTNYFNGKLSSLAFWDIAITESEINENILNQSINNEQNLIVDYRFNTSYGSTLYDHSGNQNHGTIYGAEWVSDCTPNGDTNGDSNINVTDIVLSIELIINGCSTSSDWNECNNLICSSDVNNDGEMNVSDIVVIVASIIGR